MKKHWKQARKILAVLLTGAMLLTGVSITPHKEAKASSSYDLSNPTIDAAGVATWDAITFGNYWQSDTNGDGVANQSDDKEPIVWRVLSIEEDNAFLIADQNLDCQPYNTTTDSATWETCTLRSWLNGYGSTENSKEEDLQAITLLMLRLAKKSRRQSWRLPWSMTIILIMVPKEETTQPTGFISYP